MKFIDPQHVLRQFGVFGSQHVLDLGSGAGHFALAAAPRLEGGRLYAVDVDRGMLKRLVDEAERLGHAHIHTICGDACRRGGVPLSDHSVDKILATNIFFQVDDRDAFAQEIKRLLKPGGKVLIVDWSDSHDFGPRKAHKISKDDIQAHFARHGFIYEQDIDAGDYHYGMILQAK